MKKFLISLFIYLFVYFLSYYINTSNQKIKKEYRYKDNIETLIQELPFENKNNILTETNTFANHNSFFYSRSYRWNSNRMKWSSEWYINKELLKTSEKEMKRIYKLLQKLLIAKIKQNKKYASKKKSYNFFWNSAYNYVAYKNKYRLNNIVRAFRFFQKSANLSRKKTAELLINFTQSLRYKVPKKDPLGFLQPLSLLKRKYGDCDTRALFLIIILKKMGYKALMFHSRFYSHAMLGLAVKANGYYKKYKGRRYYFVETTARGWRIGMLSKKNRNLRKWNIFKISI